MLKVRAVRLLDTRSIYKNQLFLYSINVKLKMKLKTSLFTKTIKFLGINLTKQV